MVIAPAVDTHAAALWQTFTAADGEFAVDVPGPLRDEIRRAEDGSRMRGGRVTVGGVNYVVVYSQPPDPTTALTRTVRGLRTSLHTRSEQVGTQAWRLTYALPGHTTATHLVWTTPHDLCQAIAVLPSPHRPDAEAEVKRFLASVRRP